jgi:hypothetical protein
MPADQGGTGRPAGCCPAVSQGRTARGRRPGGRRPGPCRAPRWRPAAQQGKGAAALGLCTGEQQAAGAEREAHRGAAIPRLCSPPGTCSRLGSNPGNRSSSAATSGAASGSRARFGSCTLGEGAASGAGGSIRVAAGDSAGGGARLQSCGTCKASQAGARGARLGSPAPPSTSPCRRACG